MSGSLREECGVFGILTPPGEDREPAFDTYNALFALQHRGQDSCGIAVSLRGELTVHKGKGLVPDVFSLPQLRQFQGADGAIGHVRHAANAASVNPANTQPLVVHHASGSMALCYNGTLVNSRQLRAESEHRGGIFQGTNDAEVISYLIVREHLRTHTLEDAVLNAMEYMIGAYSLVLLQTDKLIAARDPNGFRPLCVGRVGRSVVFASESCAIEALGGTFLRDVAPGEVVIADREGRITSLHCRIRAARRAFCLFELIYFARQDSVVDGCSVGAAREMAGRLLAQQNTVEGDLVIGVPDSGVAAAMGFARQSGIPYGIGLVKNRYIARTFIQSQRWEREKSLRIKLNAVSATVRDKRVILVDDSIIRGKTCARIVQLLREAGAKEVHMRVSSPPFRYQCHFGTITPRSEAMAAHGRTEEEVCRMIGADSLQYLPLEQLKTVAAGLDLDFCDACFTGRYVLPLPEEDPAAAPD
ncbi:MAG TPA: amidophosphoribosyltransferase [Candidatus Onthomonas avicola]|nr:amidophosphoribosyltransferase [Candidatus Onthomonas avicola]